MTTELKKICLKYSNLWRLRDQRYVKLSLSVIDKAIRDLSAPSYAEESHAYEFLQSGCGMYGDYLDIGADEFKDIQKPIGIIKKAERRQFLLSLLIKGLADYRDDDLVLIVDIYRLFDKKIRFLKIQKLLTWYKVGSTKKDVVDFFTAFFNKKLKIYRKVVTNS